MTTDIKTIILNNSHTMFRNNNTIKINDVTTNTPNIHVNGKKLLIDPKNVLDDLHFLFSFFGTFFNTCWKTGEVELYCGSIDYNGYEDSINKPTISETINAIHNMKLPVPIKFAVINKCFCDIGDCGRSIDLKEVPNGLCYTVRDIFKLVSCSDTLYDELLMHYEYPDGVILQLDYLQNEMDLYLDGCDKNKTTIKTKEYVNGDGNILMATFAYQC